MKCRYCSMPPDKCICNKSYEVMRFVPDDWHTGGRPTGYVFGGDAREEHVPRREEHLIWWTNLSDIERSKVLVPRLPTLRSLRPPSKVVGDVFMVSSELGIPGEVVAHKARESVSPRILAHLAPTHKGMVVSLEDAVVLRPLPGFITHLDGRLWTEEHVRTLTMKLGKDDIDHLTGKLSEETKRILDEVARKRGGPRGFKR